MLVIKTFTKVDCLFVLWCLTPLSTIFQLYPKMLNISHKSKILLNGRRISSINNVKGKYFLNNCGTLNAIPKIV